MPETVRSHIVGSISYLASAVQTPESWLGAILGILAAKLIPSPIFASALIGLLGLVVIDFITGRLKTKRIGEALSSAKLGRTIEKLLIYLLIPLFVSFLSLSTDLVAKVATEPIQVGLVVFFAVREAKSIGENLHEMGYDVPRWFWKKLPSGSDEEEPPGAE